jgi:hypothetical protein
MSLNNPSFPSLMALLISSPGIQFLVLFSNPANVTTVCLVKLIFPVTSTSAKIYLVP